MEHKTYPRLGETLYCGELPNGLRMRILEKPAFAGGFAVLAAHYGSCDRRFRIGGGDFRETPAGSAHFLEHKMFDLPDGSSALSLLSAAGADPNAYTSHGITAYHFEATAAFEENLRTLLRFVSTPYFTPESVAKEQGIIGQEIRMGDDDPGRAVYRGLLECLYASHPIRVPIAGSAESIAEITDRTLYDCWDAFYRPSNLALCVASPLPAARVAALAEEILPDAFSPRPVSDYGAPEPLLPAAARRSTAMPVGTPQFLIGAKLQPARTGSALLLQELTAELALRALTGRASAFYNTLFREGLLTEDFSAELDTACGTATVLLGGESRAPERVLEALTEAVEDVRRNGLDAAAFARTKRAVSGLRLRALDRFDDLCCDMAEGVFGGYELFDAFSLLERITPEACAAFLTESLAPDRLALSAVTPAGA